ncbi:hypothetical protein ACVIHD_007152 [Bradyrhizobium embrapense]
MLRGIDGRGNLTQPRCHRRAVRRGKVERREKRVQPYSRVASHSIERRAHLAAVGIGSITRIGTGWAGECQGVGVAALSRCTRQQRWRLQGCRHVRERACEICCIQPLIGGDVKTATIPAALRGDRERTVDRCISVHDEAAEPASIVYGDLQATGRGLQIVAIHFDAVVQTADEGRDSTAVGEATISIEQITAVTGQGCTLRDTCVVQLVIASQCRGAAGELQRKIVASNDITVVAGCKICVGLLR